MNSSLIELLVSLSLGAMTLVGAAGVLEGASHGVLANRVQRQRVAGILTVHEVLHSVLLDRDSHRFELPFRIHKNGFIRRTDRKLNDVFRGPDRALSPARSDAITTLALDLSQSLRVVAIGSRAGGGIEVLGCGINSSGSLTSDLLEVKSWAAFSLDAAVEVVVDSIRRGSGYCLNILGRLVPSMSLAAPEGFGAIHAVLLMVPILRHGTYYFDRTGQFRFLGHLGANNNENQPLMGTIPRAKLELEVASSHGQEILSAILRIERRIVLREKIHTRLARQPLHSLLVRMPLAPDSLSEQ